MQVLIQNSEIWPELLSIPFSASIVDSGFAPEEV